MQSTRGMHDILPTEVKYWQYIYKIALDNLDIANYQEIRTPILEDQSLFLKSIGEHTDIINKEMYSFTDRGGRQLTLRPEGTAAIARSIIQHKLCRQKQIQRLWYMGPMFRYERPQHGRQRQFHQLGIECYGTTSPALDAQIIYLADNILKKLQCNHYTIELNSIGSLENRKEYDIKLRDYLTKYYKDLSSESQSHFHNSTIKLLDSKDHHLQEILSEGPQITSVLNSSSLKHLEEVKDCLYSMGVSYIINPKLVRGLDYYNDTVFEFKTSLLGTQDTICGGGRYDTLTNQLGCEAIPAVGWGMGLERLLLLVQKNLFLDTKTIHFYIATYGRGTINYALSIIPLFQESKFKYEIDFSTSTIRKQIQKAHKKKAKICIIIGDEEINNQTITVKWLDEYKQITYSKQNFIKMIKSLSV
uniref:histidine--tRNA ligase n=1 Tax=Acrochaetium secundatum TaxID=209631 RepID=A0A4D6BJY1_9FLOR|nr:Histidine-tRNA ligase [Acrochaetium secundatum]QBX88364.1 Histidine-tRNA ligase [Acrochaetium secundatum]